MSQPVLSYKKYLGSVETSVEDECLHGKILYIDDVISYEGNTVAELKQAFQDAVDDYLAYCAETGKPANKAYSGSFNIRPGPELHRRAAAKARELDISLNDFITQSIQKNIQEISLTTVIEHNHNHKVFIIDAATQTKYASTNAVPIAWEEIHGTFH